MNDAGLSGFKETSKEATKDNALTAQIIRHLAPNVRGPLLENEPLAPLTWFRVGGPAELLFAPADEEDLVQVLACLPHNIPVTMLGACSNMLIRDGGIHGMVIRLGKGFREVEGVEEDTIRAGAALPDLRLAQMAAQFGIGGLEFFRGIPGTVGGALRMNAGAHGGETKDVLVSAKAVNRRGERLSFLRKDLPMFYRHVDVPEDIIFTEAVFKGVAEDRIKIEKRMEVVQSTRESAQPIKSRTGGSTFKNPENGKAWQLIDAAGCRGLRIGDAEVSTMHCNFLINRGQATAADIENLGETVRKRVKENSGIELQWEIRRVGSP